MSINLIIHLHPESLPTPEQWQANITRHGFDLKLDTDFNVKSFSGYLPCIYQGVETGFEYFYEAPTSASSANISVELITHANYQEHIAAAIAAAVLTEISGGTLEEPQEGTNYSGAQAIVWAKETAAEVLVEASKPQRLPLEADLTASDKPWWKFW